MGNRNCALCRFKHCLRTGRPCRSVEALLPPELPERADHCRLPRGLPAGFKRHLDVAARRLHAIRVCFEMARAIRYKFTEKQWRLIEVIWEDAVPRALAARQLGIGLPLFYYRLHCIERVLICHYKR